MLCHLISPNNIFVRRLESSFEGKQCPRNTIGTLFRSLLVPPSLSSALLRPHQSTRTRSNLPDLSDIRPTMCEIGMRGDTLHGELLVSDPQLLFAWLLLLHVIWCIKRVAQHHMCWYTTLSSLHVSTEVLVGEYRACAERSEGPLAHSFGNTMVSLDKNTQIKTQWVCGSSTQPRMPPTPPKRRHPGCW